MKTKGNFHRTASAFAIILLSAVAPAALAFPATKEKADLTLNFTLSPVDSASTASGTASIHVTRLNGVETDDAIDLTLSGLADGTYTVNGLTKSDPAAPPILIGSVIVSAIPDPNAPPLTLPDGLSALDIATLTISDATPTVVLTGEPTEDIVKWRYFANRPLVAPATTTTVRGAKKLHGHVLVHAVIIENVELRRKFLLVGHGLPTDSTLTVNLDGVAVGEVTTTKNGKAMLKSLDGDFRLAGTHLLTLTDDMDNTVAEVDFFPIVE
jgi:hypothetical protein